MSFFKGKEILITGGAGTLGKAITKTIAVDFPDANGIRIYSRDEEKHRLMAIELSGSNVPISYLVGDIRDQRRLSRAMNGVDLVIHAAAMKQVPSCEYNPIEAVRTNVEGTCNVIEAAIDNLVQKVMLISTDKACYPINLYGATKATAEKLFLHANVYAPYSTRFSICRYGNVFGSRGSVVQMWREQFETIQKIKITDPEMTRFWITIGQVAQFVLDRLIYSQGSEIFIPNMKSSDMLTFAKAVMNDEHEQLEIEKIGARKGEKKHECLITREESIYAKILPTHFEIKMDKIRVGVPFTFTSKNADRFKEEEIYDFSVHY